MRNSPYLDRPLLSLKERMADDARAAFAKAWQDAAKRRFDAAKESETSND